MTPSMNRILRDMATHLHAIQAAAIARVPPAANPFAKPAKPITAAEAIRALPDKDFYTMIVAEVDRRGLGYERFGDGISRHGHEAYRRMMNKGWG
jgi:hypothetical protein